MLFRSRLLGQAGERIAVLGLRFRAEEEAVVRLAREGYDPANGARPLRRKIHTYVEDPVAEGILNGKFVSGDSLTLCIVDDQLVVKKEETEE